MEADYVISAFGYDDNRVAPCGDGKFCCCIDNKTNYCSTPSNILPLGVATVVETVTGHSPTLATTNSENSATSAAVNTPTYSCPDLNGSSYTDATGSSYRIQCSADYHGNDLPAVQADTFEEYLERCDTYVPQLFANSNAACIGVSWWEDKRGINCYRKHRITTINTNDDGLSSAYYVNYTLSDSAMTNEHSNPSDTNAPATSSAHSATSTIIKTPTLSGCSDSHMAVGVGVGVGVGICVPAGLVIVAGFCYLIRRQSKTRSEEVLEMNVLAANDKKDSGLTEPMADGRLDELPTEDRSGVLFESSGPRAELAEIHGHRAEIG